jgi:hypothetical protein
MHTLELLVPKWELWVLTNREASLLMKIPLLDKHPF